MPRPTKKSKPYIVVFCEGESEQVYTDFLRKEFKDVASIKRPSSTGLFEEADSKFQKDKAYQGYAEVTDEIWFFFDVETKDIGSWDARMKIIKRLRSLRKRPGIKVRLLMTTGCIYFPKYIAKHGMPKMRFHDLRHSCASLLLANGVPLKQIQEWLGHSDFSTTANIYAHLDYRSKISSAQAMEQGMLLPRSDDFGSRWENVTEQGKITEPDLNPGF